jgi:Flp pilus assembly protein protease CpaA
MLHLAVPSIILIGAVITDLRTKKIFNWYIVAAALCGFASSFYFMGKEGIIAGLLGAGLALVITLPLFFTRILGGGDVKLLIAFGLGTSYATILNVVVGSFICAALIGLIYATLNGTIKILALNTFAILKGEKREKLSIHHLPFSVAIFMAWVTYLVMQHTGGDLW